MTTLSVCTFTNDPLAAVATSLGAFRDVADEIVAVVDADAPTNGLDALDAVCDRVVIAPFIWPLEANLAWLEDRCSGDWVLRVDGDEVPSAALLRRLADRSWADDVTHAFVTRRWLIGDTSTMLDQAPWWIDPQCRLVRRGVVDWAATASEVHGVPVIPGPSRLLVEPVYHLDLIVTSHVDRLDRARRYETANPGLLTEGGRPQNVAYYLPEAHRATLVTTPVPSEDRDLLDAVARGFTETGAVAHVRVPEVSRVDPRPSRNTVGLSFHTPAATRHVEGSRATMTVTVTNRSDHTWSRSDRSPVQIGARILNAVGAPVAPETRRGLPGRVRPGQSETVDLHIGPMPGPGSYHVSIGALREGVAWFEPTLDVPVEVTRRPRILLSSGISPDRHLGDDMIVTTVLDALQLAAMDLEVTLLADDPAGATARFGVPAIGRAPTTIPGDTRPGSVLRAFRRFREDARRVAKGAIPLHEEHIPLLSALGAGDALVVLGAGWFTSAFRRDGMAPHFFEIEAAHELRCPVVFEAGSVGPFTGLTDRVVARRLLRDAVHVGVRDRASRATVRRLGVPARRIHLTPDVATAYPHVATAAQVARWAARAGFDPNRPYSVVSLRGRRDSADTVEAVGAALTTLGHRGIQSVFLAHHRGQVGDDRTAARALAAVASVHVLDDDVPDRVAASIIDGASFVIGDRFHLGILAARRGIPGVFVPADRYDRHRAHAFAGTSIGVTPPSRVAAAVETASERVREAPAAPWDGPAFAAMVERVVTRPGRVRREIPAQPPIVVGVPDVSLDGTRVEVDIDGTPVTFTSHDTRLDPVPEAWGTAFALPASMMRRGIDLPGPTDPTWLDGVARNVELAHGWFGGLSPLSITSRDATTRTVAGMSGRARDGDGTAVCFTGGVDSFHTLLNTRPRPTHLLFVVGFDLDTDDTERIGWIRSTLDDVAAGTDTTPIVVTTDLRSHPIFAGLTWELTHGAALAATGHLLHGTIGRLIIPPSFAQHRLRPWGSRPDMDPNWSVPRRLEVIHGDNSIGRLERLTEIADDPLMHRNLRVCWQNRSGERNCGRCEKCVRTMVVLASLDRLDAVVTFPDRAVLAERLDGIEHLPPHIVPVWQDLRPDTLRPDEVRAFDALIERSRVTLG